MDKDKTIYIFDIQWDTEDDSGFYPPEDLDLPTELEVTIGDILEATGEEPEDNDELIDVISDYISDRFGFCHAGFRVNLDGEEV